MNKNSDDKYLHINHLKKNLKEHAVRGGVVTLGSQFFLFVFGMVSTAVLARLLTPDDHGLIFMVMPIIGFIYLFKDLGLSQATVQKADITHRQISMLFWVNLTFSSILMVATVIAAPLIARFYSRPQLTLVTIALAFGFFMGGLTVQHQALLRRQMRFHIIAVIDVVAAIFGLAAGIVSAMYGLKYWALVIKTLVTAAVTEAGVWIACGWRPSPPRLGSGAFSMIRFGAHITGFNILNYGSANIANVLIGKFSGAQPVALFGKAKQLTLIPIQQINYPISPVAISSLSRLAGNPEAYRRAYLRILEKIAMITMPGVAALIATADWVVMAMLGPQWTAVTQLFTLLGIAALFKPINNTMGWLFISQGRTRHMFKWGIISGIITICSICAGLPWGVVGVTASFSFVSVFLSTPLLYWFTGKTGPVRTRDIYRTIASPAFVSVCLFLALSAFRRLSQIDIKAGVPAAMLISVVVTLLLYVILPDTRKALGDFMEMAMINRRGKGKI
ncbi:MAG: lipopolysaccharide biosynthesis protein [Candidatus Latescibacteria bacterium]|jgi:O-antigen/teichoic acid export membrane protein|nr:lipopolysaccharide biosynthesis protein [Candidatus Latescibacterota bacterium]